MGKNRIAAYKLYPNDGKSLIKADENTIFISAVPSLKNYTFKIVVEKVEGKDTKYYLTRLS